MNLCSGHNGYLRMAATRFPSGATVQGALFRLLVEGATSLPARVDTRAMSATRISVRCVVWSLPMKVLWQRVAAEK